MIKPLGDNVLIKKVKQETATKSGLIITPETNAKEDLIVEAIGTDKNIKVKVGEKVIISHSGTVFKDYILVRNDAILGIIEN